MFIVLGTHYNAWLQLKIIVNALTYLIKVFDPLSRWGSKFFARLWTEAQVYEQVDAYVRVGQDVHQGLQDSTAQDVRHQGAKGSKKWKHFRNKLL